MSLHSGRIHPFAESIEMQRKIEREIIEDAPVCVTGGVVMLWCAICKFGCGCDVFAATAQSQSGVDWLFCVAVLKCWVRQSHRIWCPGVCVDLNWKANCFRLENDAMMS